MRNSTVRPLRIRPIQIHVLAAGAAGLLDFATLVSMVSIVFSPVKCGSTWEDEPRFAKSTSTGTFFCGWLVGHGDTRSFPGREEPSNALRHPLLQPRRRH